MCNVGWGILVESTVGRCGETAVPELASHLGLGGKGSPAATSREEEGKETEWQDSLQWILQ